MSLVQGFTDPCGAASTWRTALGYLSITPSSKTAAYGTTGNPSYSRTRFVQENLSFAGINGLADGTYRTDPFYAKRQLYPYVNKPFFQDGRGMFDNNDKTLNPVSGSNDTLQNRISIAGTPLNFAIAGDTDIASKVMINPKNPLSTAFAQALLPNPNDPLQNRPFEQIGNESDGKNPPWYDPKTDPRFQGFHPSLLGDPTGDNRHNDDEMHDDLGSLTPSNVARRAGDLAAGNGENVDELISIAENEFHQDDTIINRARQFFADMGNLADLFAGIDNGEFDEDVLEDEDVLPEHPDFQAQNTEEPLRNSDLWRQSYHQANQYTNAEILEARQILSMYARQSTSDYTSSTSGSTSTIPVPSVNVSEISQDYGNENPRTWLQYASHMLSKPFSRPMPSDSSDALSSTSDVTSHGRQMARSVASSQRSRAQSQRSQLSHLQQSQVDFTNRPFSPPPTAQQALRVDLPQEPEININRIPAQVPNPAVEKISMVNPQATSVPAGQVGVGRRTYSQWFRETMATTASVLDTVVERGSIVPNYAVTGVNSGAFAPAVQPVNRREVASNNSQVLEQVAQLRDVQPIAQGNPLNVLGQNSLSTEDLGMATMDKHMKAYTSRGELITDLKTYVEENPDATIYTEGREKIRKSPFSLDNFTKNTIPVTTGRRDLRDIQTSKTPFSIPKKKYSHSNIRSFSPLEAPLRKEVPKRKTRSWVNDDYTPNNLKFMRVEPETIGYRIQYYNKYHQNRRQQFAIPHHDSLQNVVNSHRTLYVIPTSLDAPSMQPAPPDSVGTPVVPKKKPNKRQKTWGVNLTTGSIHSSVGSSGTDYIARHALEGRPRGLASGNSKADRAQIQSREQAEARARIRKGHTAVSIARGIRQTKKIQKAIERLQKKS